MKKSGYRTIFHIYLIFLLGLLGAFLASACFFFLLITFKLYDLQRCPPGRQAGGKGAGGILLVAL